MAIKIERTPPSSPERRGQTKRILRNADSLARNTTPRNAGAWFAWRVSERAAVERTIRSYASAWDARDRAQWLAAFRVDATQEDPVGGRVRRGHAEIGEFFDDGLRHWSNGLTITPERIHVLGPEAAMVWRIDASRPGERIEFEGVDVFTFDDDARVATVRAYWEDEMRRRFRD